jgi:predicted O-methyltransferase YrrM
MNSADPGPDNSLHAGKAGDVLRSILETGRTILPSGDDVAATSCIDRASGALLQRAIRKLRPSIAVEVGLAFGISTLYILDALSEVGGEKLIGIDPAQHDDHWRGGGLHNVLRSGYNSLYEFHEDTSQRVLPRLVAKGQRVDFAFVDGWHTLDHVLVDFFYIDQMLRVGGVVVFDDVGYPSIRRACDFIVTNRDYELYDCLRLKANKRFDRHGKYMLNRLLRPLTRTDKTPARVAQQHEHEIDDVYFLALRKRSDDNRRFDDFVHF